MNKTKRTIRFKFEGRTYQVEVERSGDQLIVEREGERYRVELLPEQEAVTGAPAGTSPPVPSSIAGEPAAKPSPAKAAPLSASGVLYAPMTGLVKEIKVAVGHGVKKGEVVLVMEAMKMDVEVSSPAAGVVAEIAVQAGDTVESQALLMIIR